jgi:hypothetical protein
MKTAYFIILFCACLTSCHSQTKNNEMKNDLNISLLFSPSIFSIDDIRYSIDIVNDSLIVKKQIIDNKEYIGMLTSNQYEEIKKLTSKLNQKYNRSDRFRKGGWGCILKVDNQIYYEDNDFSFNPYSKYIDWQELPEEIKLLIDYIVSLSPIPIELYGFS